MDIKFKTTKEYKKLKRDFIKDIFLLSSVTFLVVLVGSAFLSFFIYLLILSWNDKDFSHYLYLQLLYIYVSVIVFMGIIFAIIMYIKYIFEIKVEFYVEKGKLNQYWQIEGVDKIE
ncbi:Spiroplasmavirus-related protein [Spiroplasma kunkelii CR2-3x]|uniref:Spiroplasmavirus-related protein n=1 Tax=Spiroplasma kunkelii CR2-3x TaxID=273035 RepID=A0A0K2JHQ3_SPIKU|nr:hypothetical protein [Spiroplasma kunkelii]ALA97963.1 Spiroplasmavirus-related protein [Spiroplasma kunkelii CR2-3x]